MNLGVDFAEFSLALNENLKPLAAAFLKDITNNHHKNIIKITIITIIVRLLPINFLTIKFESNNHSI